MGFVCYGGIDGCLGGAWGGEGEMREEEGGEGGDGASHGPRTQGGGGM